MGQGKVFDHKVLVILQSLSISFDVNILNNYNAPFKLSLLPDPVANFIITCCVNESAAN